MLGDTGDTFDFMPTPVDTLGITGTPVTPLSSLNAAFLAPPFGSAHTTRAPVPLAGTDSPAFTRLHRLFQQREARAEQVALDYDRLK